MDLLDLDSGTRILKLLLELRRFVLVDAFLDRLRRALDEVLGLFETEARDRTDFLDHVDLLVAEGRENDVELGLLGSRCGSCRTATAGGCDGNRGSGRDTPLLFEHLRELGCLDDGEGREIVNQFRKI